MLELVPDPLLEPEPRPDVEPLPVLLPLGTTVACCWNSYPAELLPLPPPIAAPPAVPPVDPPVLRPLPAAVPPEDPPLPPADCAYPTAALPVTKAATSAAMPSFDHI